MTQEVCCFIEHQACRPSTAKGKHRVYTLYSVQTDLKSRLKLMTRPNTDPIRTGKKLGFLEMKCKLLVFFSFFMVSGFNVCHVNTHRPFSILYSVYCCHISALLSAERVTLSINDFKGWVFSFVELHVRNLKFDFFEKSGVLKNIKRLVFKIAFSSPGSKMKTRRSHVTVYYTTKRVGNTFRNPHRNILILCQKVNCSISRNSGVAKGWGGFGS